MKKWENADVVELNFTATADKVKSTCPYCNKQLGNANALNNHIKSEHPFMPAS